MAQSPIFPAFMILMVATILWLALVWRLFALLKVRAPELYASLGQPHMILNNTPSNNIAFLRFLMGGHYGRVADKDVRKLCAFLRVFFWVYLVWFLGLAAAVFVVTASGI
jgi:hypothetical protein